MRVLRRTYIMRLQIETTALKSLDILTMLPIPNFLVSFIHLPNSSDKCLVVILFESLSRFNTCKDFFSAPPPQYLQIIFIVCLACVIFSQTSVRSLIFGSKHVSSKRTVLTTRILQKLVACLLY